MIVIDPARNPQPYYDFASRHSATIAGVIETHPHADFVSSHLEIHEHTGATIYTSKLTGALYPHQTFDDGDVIPLGEIRLKALNTPGHSPDSICIVLEEANGEQTAIFTGDTLFVGDVGRPDLRENVGNITAKKEELARAMYQSTRQKLMPLPPKMLVYPAHGPGSLCGRNMSPDLHSTIGRELRENYALQLMSEPEFVDLLIADQPFAPVYFGHDVELNKKGAVGYQQGIDAIDKVAQPTQLDQDVTIVDTRPRADFRKGHVHGAINLQNGEKFETWLGSVIKPGEPFYLIAATAEELKAVIAKASKIGYEDQIKAAMLTPNNTTAHSAELDLDTFERNPDSYTIVDVRNWTEINTGKAFENALTIPLPELRDRLDEIPTNKPIVVHCAAGYRSAAAASIVAGKTSQVPVYDLGEVITRMLPVH